MSIDVNVQNDLVIVTETTEDIVVNVSNAAGPQGPAGAAGVGVPVGGTTGQVLKKFTNTNYDTYWTADASGLTSVGLSVPTGLTVTNSPLTTNGTIALGLASGYSIPTTASQATWNTAYNDSIVSAAVTGTTTKTLTLNQQDGGSVTASWSDLNTDAVTSVFGRTGAVVATEGDYTLTQLGDVTLTSPTNGQVLKYNGTTWVNNTDTDTGLTSVGLSMPSAFSVSNSPLTSNGTLAVTGAGTSAQYVRGDGQLANFPTNGGGGSSVNYYLNGSVSQGTFGGDTYYEMSKTPIIGAGTNFTRTNAQGNGYIASFITDAGDPALLNIPGGNWNVEFYFQASSGGGNPSFYAELYKVSSSNVFTLIGSGSTNPEGITNGTAVDQYFTSIPVPQTALLATDRLAIRIFVTPSGRTITLHTENGNLCEVLTTFSTGLNALNGLTTQVQYFATGTSGTDFNISSVTDTHTFNLPIASGTNTGKLSNTDWTTFNSKQNAITLTTTGSSGASTFISNTLNVPTYTLSGLGGVPTSRTLTINGTAFDLSADRTFSVGTVTSVAALTLGTTGTDLSSTVANGTTTPVITLNVPTASATNRGALSSADWTTFNNKQNTITNPVTGTGTTNYLPKWTSGSAIGNSLVFDDGTNVGIGTTSPAAKLDVVGAATFSSSVTATSATFTNGVSNTQLTVNGIGAIKSGINFANGGTTYGQIYFDNNAPYDMSVLQQYTTGSLIFGTNNTERMRLDASGNLGLGVQPSAWNTYKAIQIGEQGVVSAYGSGAAVLNIGTNFYWDGAGYKRIVTGEATQYQQNTGEHNWRTAPSGIAGAAITFTQAMTLTSNGNLLLNTTTDSGEKLQVNGNGTFGGRTIVGASYIADLGGVGNNCGILFGPGAVLSIDGTGTLATKNLGSSANPWGTVYATSFIKSGGTSSQYLMADGSVTTGGGGGSVDELQVALICQVFG